jgi:hypothetical protein
MPFDLNSDFLNVQETGLYDDQRVLEGFIVTHIRVVES